MNACVQVSPKLKVRVSKDCGGDSGGFWPVDGPGVETGVITEAGYMLELQKELERVQNKILRAYAKNWASGIGSRKLCQGQEEGISGGSGGDHKAMGSWKVHF